MESTVCGMNAKEIAYLCLSPLVVAHRYAIQDAAETMPLADAIFTVLEKSVESSFDAATDAGLPYAAECVMGISWLIQKDIITDILPLLEFCHLHSVGRNVAELATAE